MADVKLIIGANWGDEGKGKVDAYFSKEADLVIRATGGANAGHTVYYNNTSGETVKMALHLVPGGIVYNYTMCLIGQGVALDMEVLQEELKMLSDNYIFDPKSRVKISGTCNVVMPYHKDLDRLHESLKSKKIGTTGKGIGPAYSDNRLRTGLLVYDLLLSEQELASKIAVAIKAHNELFIAFNMSECVVDPNELATIYHSYGKFLKDNNMVVNGHEFVKKYLDNPLAKIVVEGAQSTRLSIENGGYPNCTSSDSNTLGTLSGAHLSHKDVTEVINVNKAYFTRVGNGPFPTEYVSHINSQGELTSYEKQEAFEGDILREIGKEYGATTGRPRRTGAFDAVLAKNSAEISGADYLCITRLDTLGEYGLEHGSVQICTEYKYEGKNISYYPDNMEFTHETPTPNYITFDGGWKIDSENMKTFDSLPFKARLFIKIIEETTGVPVKYIGTGPNNCDLIVRDI